MRELDEERRGDKAGSELGREYSSGMRAADEAAALERREDVVDERPAVSESHTPPQIRLGQRVLFVGKTGEGKSEAALGFWALHGGQRLLIDVQDHYTLGRAALAEDPPPLEVDDPRAIDWQHRTIRYVPRRPGDRREMDALYAAIYRRGNMLVLADELEDIAPSQGPGAGFHIKKVLKQGRKYRITHLGATQRPAGVDRSAINQAEHAFIFRMVDPDDIDTLSRRVGMRARDLGDALGAMAQYEHLRHTIGDRQVLHMPPLPAAVLDHTHGHVLNPEHSRR